MRRQRKWQKNWLLSGWEVEQPDANGEVSTQSAATQSEPTFSRQELGAGLKGNIPQNPDNESLESKKTGRFSIAPVTHEMDVAYLDAVERGDMEAAGRMVEDAARSAGYTVKTFHGAEKNFGLTEFEVNRKTGTGIRTDTLFFASRIDVTETYSGAEGVTGITERVSDPDTGDRIGNYAVFIDPGKNYVVENRGRFNSRLKVPDDYRWRDTTKYFTTDEYAAYTEEIGTLLAVFTLFC